MKTPANTCSFENFWKYCLDFEKHTHRILSRKGNTLSLNTKLRIFKANVQSLPKMHKKCLNQTKQETIATQLRKWNWTGYTPRRNEKAITKQALTWNPNGKKRQKKAKKHPKEEHSARNAENGTDVDRTQTMVEAFHQWSKLK